MLQMTMLHLIIRSTWYLLRQELAGYRLQAKQGPAAICSCLQYKLKVALTKKYILLHVNILWDPVGGSSNPLDIACGDTEHMVHHKIMIKKQLLSGPLQKMCCPWVRSLGYRTRTPVSCTMIPCYLSSQHQHSLHHVQYRVTARYWRIRKHIACEGQPWTPAEVNIISIITTAIYDNCPYTNASLPGDDLPTSTFFGHHS